jgi:RHS repeat-associated protein
VRSVRLRSRALIFASRRFTIAATVVLLVPLLAVPSLLAGRGAADPLVSPARASSGVPASPAGTAPRAGAVASPGAQVLTGGGYVSSTTPVPPSEPNPSLSGTGVGGISTAEQTAAGPAAVTAAVSPSARTSRGVKPDVAGSPPAFLAPAWTVQDPASLPPGLVYASMVYDGANNTTVVFGGYSSSGLSSNTYVWNGTTWTNANPTNHPSARASVYLAYDALSSQKDVVLFGGYNGTSDLADTWTWNGSNWTQQTPATSPSARSGGAAAYLPADSNVIIFGGSMPTADTWGWNGTTWVSLAPATSPSLRNGESLVDDPASGDLLMFGGRNGSTYDNDTWTYNGSTWTSLSPANAPPALSGGAMAYDPTLARVVLVGGVNAGGTALGGVYAWDETNWRTAVSPTAISARAYSGLAQSPANGQLVAFGGMSGSTFLDDTQTFDWAQLGAQPDYQLQKFRLDDQETVAVNPANGNLVVSANDYTVNGVGQPLTISRTFNSQWRLIDLQGDNWGFNGAPDAYVSQGLNTNDVYTVGLQGAETEQDFRYNATTQTYAAPAGMDADLLDTSGVFTLTQHQSGAVTTLGGTNSGGSYNETAVVDNNGHGITDTFNNTSGLLTVATDAETRTYAYTDDPTTGEITKITDNGSGYDVQYGYTGGMLTSYTDADNNTPTMYGYNSSGQLTSVTSPDGREITISYDAYDRVTSVTQVTNPSTGAGYQTSFSYQPATTGDSTVNGVLRTLVTAPDQQPSGASTTFVTNHLGQVVNTINADGQTLNGTTYDQDAQPSSVTDALSAVTSLSHDSLENLKSITSPNQSGGAAGASSSLAYPTPTTPPTGSNYPLSDYRPSSGQDSQGNTTSYTYDTGGNLDTTKDGLAAQNTITNAYQGDGSTTCSNAKTGELCSTTDARGNKTTFAYHSQGDLETITPPAPLTATNYGVNADSEVISVADPRGITTRYAYDADGRVTEVRNDGANTATCDTADASADKCVGYGYDQDGNLTSRLDVTGTTMFAYDTVGRITTETFPNAATSGVGYDASSNITSYADAGGTVTYYYDAANRLINLAEPNGSCPATPTYPNSTLCTGFVDNANGARTKTEYPNGETVTVGLDTSGRDMSILAVDGSLNIANLTYNYDTGGTTATGLVQSVTDAVRGTTATYGYDALNRLHTATTGSTVDTYNYDGAGNQTSSTVTGGTTMNYSVDNANQLCYWTTGTATDGTTACPTTPGGAHGYAYDADGNQTVGGSTFTLGYSNYNQLASDTMSGSTSDYTYADIGSSNLTASGNTTLLNGLLGTTASTTTAGTTYFTRDPSDTLISMRTSAGSSYYTLDRQGSVVALTNSTPANTALYSYGPYGTVTESGSQDTVNPYLYAGGYKDPTSGLLKFGQRYYNTGLGDWTQQDPLDQINNVSQANRYVYAGDNPINTRDPLGQSGIFGDAEAGGEYAGITGTFVGCAAGGAVGAVGGAPALGFAAVPGAVVGCGVVGAALGGFTGALGVVGGGIVGAISDIF